MSKRERISKDLIKVAIENIQEDKKQLHLSGDDPFELTFIPGICKVGPERVLSYDDIEIEIKKQTPLGRELTIMYGMDLDRKVKAIVG